MSFIKKNEDVVKSNTPMVSMVTIGKYYGAIERGLPDMGTESYILKKFNRAIMSSYITNGVTTNKEGKITLSVKLEGLKDTECVLAENILNYEQEWVIEDFTCLQTKPSFSKGNKSSWYANIKLVSK